jgi:hypothetical protein
MMTKISYDGYRFPSVIIQQAIWLYARFTLSFRDVEDLLAERGITVSYETVRPELVVRGVGGVGCRGAPPSGRWRLDPIRHMLTAMLIQYTRSDFSVAVKSSGKPLHPWRWEIYRAGRSSALARSSTFFPTMVAANKAGKEALAQLLRKF